MYHRGAVCEFDALKHSVQLKSNAFIFFSKNKTVIINDLVLFNCLNDGCLMPAYNQSKSTEI